MDCPNCGAYNHPQNFRCIRCGHVLPPEDVSAQSGSPTEEPETTEDDQFGSPSYDDEVRWPEEPQQRPVSEWANPPTYSAPPPTQQHSQPGQQWTGTATPTYGSYRPDVPNYLWQSIAVTLCCCWPLGIPAIVYAARVNAHVASGDITAAQDASSKARTWTFVSLGAGLFIYIGLICVAIVSEGAAV
jgi:hypothetical protein